MSENLQSLLKEALLNNSYDYDDLHESIKKEWQSSYSYLYYLQKAKIEYEELFYDSNDTISRDNTKIGDLHLDKLLNACFDVDYDCIGYYREPYRTSKYYNKSITFEDMIYNPNIFYKIPIVIIDDSVIYDYKVKIKVDSTEFTLPFKRNFVIENARNTLNDDIIYKKHKIQVLMIDNIYYQRFTYNKNTINYNHATKTIKLIKSDMVEKTNSNIVTGINTSYMKDYGVRYVNELNATQISKINKEIERRKKVVKIPEKTGKFFLSLHFPNDVGKTFELGSQLIEMNESEDGTHFIASLPDDVADILKNNLLNFFVSVIFMNNLHSHTFYHGSQVTTAFNGGSDIIVLEESENKPYSCPIPVENFIIFKQTRNTKNWVLQKNYDMIDMYYPNIYILNEDNMIPGDSYKVYYFYYNEPDLKYTCLFDFYFKFLSDIFDSKPLEKIINDIYYDRYEYDYTENEKIIFKRLFNKVLNYTAYHYKYGDMDFTKRYLKDTRNFDKVPIEYKDETFKKWIKEDPWVLRDYVKKQNEVGSSYHLFANTLDLPSRLRLSTATEIGTQDLYMFDEPRYVFAFNNERDYPELLDCRVFVDGLLVGDVYQRRKLFMDYFYIPQSYIKPDSYIELEVFPRYTYTKEFELSSMDDVVEFNIAEPTENISPTVADLIVWEDKDETKKTTVTETTRFPFKRLTLSGDLVLDSIFTTYEFNVSSRAARIESAVGISKGEPIYGVCIFYDNEGRKLSRGCLNSDYDELLSTDEAYIVDSDIPEGTKKIRVTTKSSIINEPIFYIYEKVPDDGRVKSRFDTSEFKITSKYSRGNFEVSSNNPDKPVKFTRLSSFSVSANSIDAVSKKFKLSFSKIPIMVRFTIGKAGYAYIDTKNDKFNYSTEYIRVFRNGRLVPKVKYRLLTGYTTPRILFMEWFDVGDIIYIDITPYRYTQIYHKKNLTKKDTLIDLRGVINKPFDISYYDVYLNGRKLSLNNVFAITPWLIAIVNMKSNYNLDIYEKERDWEYFGLDYTETDYYFSFEELVVSGVVKDEEYCKLIKDRIDELKDPRLVINPNEFNEDPLDYSDTAMIYPIFYIFYYDELVPKTYVNPDENQFNEKFIDENFTEISDRYKSHPKDYARNVFELNRRKDLGKVLCLDPDIFIESIGWRETPLYLQFKDRAFNDAEYAEDGTLILDAERVKADPSSSVYDSDHYFVGPDGMVYNLGENLYHDLEDPEYGSRGESIFRFRDRVVEDAYFDGNGVLILNAERNEPPEGDSDFYYIGDKKLVYDMSEDLYEDEEDQPLVPDGYEYLRLKDRVVDDGWYYDEYGRLVIDSERVRRNRTFRFSLDGQVYEDELMFSLMNGARLAYDVGHMDDVPDKFLAMDVNMHPENNI